MTEKFTPFDPSEMLESASDIALFLADAAETKDSGFLAHAQEIAERARARNQARDRTALAVAIGSLRLEGIEPDAEALADMERVVSGEFTIEDAIQNITARAKQA